jgi:hypothetical protein
LPDPDSADPNILPPPGTSEIVAIDPVTDKIIQRLQLPAKCSTPHGMIIDDQQHTAFIACTDPPENLIRVDLQAMRVISDPFLRLPAAPDIVKIDHPLHVLYVACNGQISVFDESNGSLRKLGDYVMGKGTHTMVVDEQTHLIYLPMPNLGGRPILRIAKYNSNGV